MAHFYANIQGNRGEATRMGTKDSGMGGHVRGWYVGCRVTMDWNEKEQRDECRITVTHGSSGYAQSRCLGTFFTKRSKKGKERIVKCRK